MAAYKAKIIDGGGNEYELQEILTRLGWTPSELARRSGVDLNRLDDIINLVRSPTPLEANAVQLALGEAGEYLDVIKLWPETFISYYRRPEREHSAGVRLERLWSHFEGAPPSVPDGAASELEMALKSAMSGLPKRIHEVLDRHFWQGESFRQIGTTIGITHSRARQLQVRGLRLLKNSHLARSIIPFLPARLKKQPPRTWPAAT